MSTRIRDMINNLFAEVMIDKIFSMLREFKSTLRNEFGEYIELGNLEAIEPIERIKGVFTDGSNVVAERRGAGLAVFSATSLVYEITQGAISFQNRYILTPDNLLLLLVPRFYLGTRANMIMRGLEYIASLYAIQGENGVSLAVYDGSYSSTLLSAQWGIEHLYRDLRRLLNEDKQLILNVCNSVSKDVKKFLDEVFSSVRPHKIVQKFFVGYPKTIVDVYEATKQSNEIPSEADIALLNFIAMFIENNFAFWALKKLFEEAKKNNIFLLWINKEPESRVLTKKVRNKAVSVFTDVVVLDYSLGKGDYIIFKAVPEIKAENMYVEAKFRNSSTHALIPNVAKYIYGNYGRYTIVYVKYRDYTIQFSYPQGLVDEDGYPLRLIKTFESISPNGYPIPLQHAHTTTAIRLRLADIIADSILNSAKGEYAKLLRLLIGVTGRRLAGV